MGRKVDAADIVGATEIAQRLGVKRPGVVHDWRRRYADFPPPITRLALGFVWAWPDVEAWARRSGRLMYHESTADAAIGTVGAGKEADL